MIVLLFVFSPGVRASAYRLVNAGADFKAYVEKNRNAGQDERLQAWLVFEKKYALYYSQGLVCDSAEPGCLDSKKLRLQNFFTQLPQFETEMWELFAHADELTSTQLQKFKAHFSDIRENIPVVFLPSLLSFNGLGGLSVHGDYTLVIGVDLFALRRNNRDVLFSHELFHNYQFDKLKGGILFQSLASPLWTEGLAVWVSQQFNPQASQEDLLMGADLARFCESDQNVAAMARDYRSFLKMASSDASANQLKIKWFSAAGPVSPTRRGYCLGLKAIGQIMKTHRIEEVLSVSEANFQSLLDGALQDLGGELQRLHNSKF